jgi:hypothetical protein
VAIASVDAPVICDLHRIDRRLGARGEALDFGHRLIQLLRHARHLAQSTAVISGELTSSSTALAPTAHRAVDLAPCSASASMSLTRLRILHHRLDKTLPAPPPIAAMSDGVVGISG